MTLVYILIVAVAVLSAAAWFLRRRSRESSPRVAETGDALAPAPVRGLRNRLATTRNAFTGRLGGVLGRSRLDDGFWADLEDSLVSADVGVSAAAAIVAAVRRDAPTEPSEVWSLLATEMVQLLSGRERDLDFHNEPAVVLVVGVNGSGKTTTIAKLAARLQNSGNEVLLGAADTFRAAAGGQLRTWADRIGADVVGGQSGADPASVAYDAYHAAKARGATVLIVDTAGRLHSKSNLMDELAKIARVLRREAEEVDEVLLVLDGTTGQNAIGQARAFTDVVGVTGIVLTKLDGTARGGIAFAVEQELDIPVKFIGVGEGAADLIPFDPEEFVDALLGT